ncbi:hypothetical protein C2845_PM10G02590 [Panicum miliaceum]|uniref:Uncharacterized protein n=1 Tax=Panicum miliaceum TaxID=4540 RepID=A0A3L6PBV1_PANMI|nr:hypothetical protein C2845_PM10G02590 [Panicum miliaceum]
MASSPAASLGFLLLLTGSSIMAILKPRGDVAAASFVAASYAGLLLLFYCLRWFEAARHGSASRDRARRGVWLTTTLLTAMFTWRVAALVPWTVAAGVCFMGASTLAGGFYALFLLPWGG